jgi:hypothetical protein
VISVADSALVVSGGLDSRFSVGGSVFHGREAQLLAEEVEIGGQSPGAYHLTNGSASIERLMLGGGYTGLFEQQGGTTEIGVVDLAERGEFRLTDGEFDGAVNFNGGIFRQTGGRSRSPLGFFSGSFILEGGVFEGTMGIPGFSGEGAVLQAGGTNLSDGLRLGDYSYWGGGSYTLSNGVLITPETSVNFNGLFEQWGGRHEIHGELVIEGALIPPSPGYVARAEYILGDGQLMTDSVTVSWGDYVQSGGTNRTRGSFVLAPSFETFATLRGGRLETENTVIESSSTGGFFQEGGVHQVNGILQVAGGGPLFHGYSLSGGMLLARDILLGPGAVLNHSGGTITQTGTLTLAGGTWHLASELVRLGAVQLGTDGQASVSFLILSDEVTVLEFAASSGLPWSEGSTLVIENWGGSIGGGGFHQVRFGQHAASLTPAQAGAVLFQDPAGLAPGVYAGVMLANGELVPAVTLPPTGDVQPQVRLVSDAEGILRLIIRGEPGKDYTIESSTDLVQWSILGSARANEEYVVTGPTGTSLKQAFFRASVAP